MAYQSVEPSFGASRVVAEGDVTHNGLSEGQSIARKQFFLDVPSILTTSRYLRNSSNLW